MLQPGTDGLVLRVWVTDLLPLVAELDREGVADAIEEEFLLPSQLTPGPDRGGLDGEHPLVPRWSERPAGVFGTEPIQGPDQLT